MPDRKLQQKSKLLFMFMLLYLTQVDGMAQRNILDVPSTQIVEKGHAFAQVQACIADRKVKSSAVFTLGLGKSWEGGVALNELTFNTRPKTTLVEMEPEIPEEYPDLLLNVQKGWQVNDFYAIGLGTRSGFSITEKNERAGLATYSFFNNSFSIPEKDDRLVLGIYYSNTAYGGDNIHPGYHIGLEKEIISNKLDVFAEYISGKSSLSVINLGIQYNVVKDWAVDLGIQLPAPGSGNSYGFALQVARD